MKCPCHSEKEYTACCAPYHNGTPAPTPEALMRSRYSAYALGNIDYIIETSTTQDDKQSIQTFCQQTIFEDLKILETTDNTVTFHAQLSQNGHDVSFTEKSLFEKKSGRWLYAHALTLT